MMNLAKSNLAFLDVDGVILDFHSGFVRFLDEEYNIKMKAEESEYLSNSGDDFPQQEKMAEFLDSKYFGELNLLADLSQYNQLAKNYTIYLITNLPEKQKKLRTQNLALHNINYQDIIFAGLENYGNLNYPTKSEAIANLDSNISSFIFLDDLPQNCEEVKQAYPKARVFLLDTLYNQQQTENYTRVSDWDDFLKHLI